MKKEKNVKSVNKDKKAKKEKSCLCPYCEEELVITSCPFCQACGAVISYCVSCQMMVLDEKTTTCPQCGGQLKREGKK
ncbi:MAG: hypothetical protein MUP49_01060 [Dehalococcoidia bacterium]|jgi:hypothetical protein|nr:hypothetical protein [Dehalococcoidia bacterium]